MISVAEKEKPARSVVATALSHGCRALLLLLRQLLLLLLQLPSSLHVTTEERRRHNVYESLSFPRSTLPRSLPGDDHGKPARVRLCSQS